MEKKFQKSGKIHPCRLYKESMQKLASLVVEGFEEDDIRRGFSISLNLPYVHIRSRDVREFLEHKELPDEFTNLSLCMVAFDNENRNIDREIDITLYVNYANLSVKGTDQAWVLGKYEQLSSFFRTTKPWFSFLISSAPMLGGIVPILSAGMFSFFLKTKHYPFAISAAILFITSILADIFHRKGTFFTHTLVLLKPKQSLISRENVNLFIAFLSLIVAIIGLFISWLK